MSFEESFSSKDWNLHQFGFLFALSVTNAYMAHNHFMQKTRNLEVMPKAEFTRLLCDDMVNNTEWLGEERNRLDELEMHSPHQ